MTGAATYLSFDIEADDLKRIIKDKNYKKKEQFDLGETELDSNPKYYMNDYLCFEREEGFGFLLLKVSSDYRKVFFHYFRP